MVAASEVIPAGVTSERGWSLFRVTGKLQMNAVGILAEISGILARVHISVLCIATYDTDYFLIRKDCEQRARQALINAGHALE